MPYYILNGHNVEQVDDIHQWAAMFENIKALIVAQTTIDNVLVSTAFIGLDQNVGNGPPLVFETLVNGEPFGNKRYLYPTWEMVGKNLIVKGGQKTRDTKSYVTEEQVFRILLNNFIT